MFSCASCFRAPPRNDIVKDLNPKTANLLTTISAILHAENDENLLRQLVRRLRSLSKKQNIEAYLTQLCYILMKLRNKGPLERFMLQKSASSLQFGLQFFMFLFGVWTDSTAAERPGISRIMRMVHSAMVTRSCSRQVVDEWLFHSTLERHPNLNFLSFFEKVSETLGKPPPEFSSSPCTSPRHDDDRVALFSSAEREKDLVVYDGGRWEVPKWLGQSGKLRFDFIERELHFVDLVTQVSENLRRYPERDKRKELLRNQLHSIDSCVPPTAYMPLVDSTQNYHRIVRILYDEAKVFSTHTRAPYMIFVEVIKSRAKMARPNFKPRIIHPEGHPQSGLERVVPADFRERSAMALAEFEERALDAGRKGLHEVQKVRRKIGKVAAAVRERAAGHGGENSDAESSDSHSDDSALSKHSDSDDSDHEGSDLELKRRKSRAPSIDLHAPPPPPPPDTDSTGLRRTSEEERRDQDAPLDTEIDLNIPSRPSTATNAAEKHPTANGNGPKPLQHRHRSFSELLKLVAGDSSHEEGHGEGHGEGRSGLRRNRSSSLTHDDLTVKFVQPVAAAADDSALLPRFSRALSLPAATLGFGKLPLAGVNGRVGEGRSSIESIDFSRMRGPQIMKKLQTHLLDAPSHGRESTDGVELVAGVGGIGLEASAAEEEEEEGEMDASKQAEMAQALQSDENDGVVDMYSENKVFGGESWQQKKRRIRRESPYGRQRGWDLQCFIVKSFDDLRQEIFAMQLIRLFSTIWKDAGLSLWLKVYGISSTSADTGFIEGITDAISLDGLKKSPGFTTLKDHFITTYGEETSEGYQQAATRYCDSLAGYSILAYLLQFKDRHNGNILLDHDGHLVHIDFGFFLSTSPGNMNFENAPFKFTLEMSDVLGSASPPSALYNKFVASCIAGFLAAREQHEQVVQLVDTMHQAVGERWPCFRAGRATVDALRERFVPHLSTKHVVSHVIKLINKSRDNWRTRQYDSFQKLQNGILP